MFAFLKIRLKFLRLGTATEKQAELDRLAKAREVLSAELKSTRVDGKPVTHRRLETLMLAAGTGKQETIRLLRGLGARPSSRHGLRLWTRDEKP
ncbi:MAG: hypothetical protein V4726_19500 [Verrucomicrobiota bacterium]